VTAGRPWALALLFVPPILLWLRLRAARPRETEASSLLVWSRVAPADAAPTRPRPPLAAWLEAAGAALLAIGVADFGVPGPAASSVRVLLDASASMEAKGPDGRTRIETAETVLGSLEGVERCLRPEERLPALLATGEPLVVVTDRRLPDFPDVPPRLQVVGVGANGFNAGVSAAWGVPLGIDRRRVRVTIEAHGAAGPVEGVLLVRKEGRPVTISPGAPLDLDLEVDVLDGEPDTLFVGVEFPGDRCDLDDFAGFRDAGGAEVTVSGIRLAGAGPLVRALRAAGATAVDLPAPYLELAAGPPENRRVLVYLPGTADAGSISGESVVTGGHPIARDVVVDPAVTLGERGDGALPGVPVLLDARGPLVTVEEHAREGPLSARDPYVHFAFLPGGTWVERDPSFVVFAKNLVEYAGGGPARLEAEGVLDPRETREAAEGETFGDLAAALEAARRPDPAAQVSFAPVLLLAAAGLLAAAWWTGR
jgi:hypothetical protein